MMIKRKLTEANVQDIREQHKAGTTLHAIAKQFNVSVPNIHLIVTRKTWKHVGERESDIHHVDIRPVATALAVLVLCAFPALADKHEEALKEKHRVERLDNERAKAEKRAKHAINWAFEHRDRPMPVANIKGDCE